MNCFKYLNIGYILLQIGKEKHLNQSYALIISNRILRS